MTCLKVHQSLETMLECDLMMKMLANFCIIDAYMGGVPISSKRQIVQECGESSGFIIPRVDEC